MQQITILFQLFSHLTGISGAKGTIRDVKHHPWTDCTFLCSVIGRSSVQAAPHLQKFKGRFQISAVDSMKNLTGIFSRLPYCFIKCLLLCAVAAFFRRKKKVLCRLHHPSILPHSQIEIIHKNLVLKFSYFNLILVCCYNHKRCTLKFCGFDNIHDILCISYYLMLFSVDIYFG